MLRGLFDYLEITCKNLKFLIVTAIGTYKKRVHYHKIHSPLSATIVNFKIYEFKNTITPDFVPERNNTC